MSQYRTPVSITAKRTRPNVVEYSVTTHDPIYGDETRTYHANRVATFMGPSTGWPANQLHGVARTLWREDDVDMARAFRRVYPGLRAFDIAQ
jgi:hypothetical protein